MTSDPTAAPLPTWSVAPFVLLVLAIAVLPMVAGRWWERNQNRAFLVVLLAGSTAIGIVAALGEAGFAAAYQAGWQLDGKTASVQIDPARLRQELPGPAQV